MRRPKHWGDYFIEPCFLLFLCCPDRFLLPSVKETHALDWKMSIFLHQLGNILPQFVAGVNSIAEIKHGGNDIERALRFQVRKLVRQPCIMRISRLGRTLHHVATPEAGVMGNDVTQVCYRFQPTGQVTVNAQSELVGNLRLRWQLVADVLVLLLTLC